MAITEQQRHHLFLRLEEVLGTEEATTLMEHLPPVGWADVATKTDLDHQRALTRADLDQLRTEVRRDIDQLRTEVGHDINQLRTEVGHDIDQLRSELDVRLERGFREQTRTMVLTNLGSMVALGSVLVAAVRI